jgi:hypothetical protein
MVISPNRAFANQQPPYAPDNYLTFLRVGQYLGGVTEWRCSVSSGAKDHDQRGQA